MSRTSRSIREFLFEFVPQEDATSPYDHAYLTIMRHMLSVLSCWPLKILDPLHTGAILRRKIWVFTQRSFHMTVNLLTMVGAIMYILLHRKSMTFFELGHLYISLIMIFVDFSRITTLCFSADYVVLARKFLEKFHLFFYKDRSEYSMATHKRVHRICHLFTVNLLCQMLFGLTLFNVIPMYNNYSAGNYARGGLKGNATYEHALYFSYPFNASRELKWYILTNIFHWMISFICASWFCMLDLFLSLMVFHIWGHFKILLYNLDHFPRPAKKTSFIPENSNATLFNEMYSASELKTVAVQLGKLVEYHRDIISFTNEMSEVFGPMLFVYYLFHQTSGCLLLLECSQMTAAALIRYLPLTLISFQQLIQLSIIFEVVGSISDKLKFAVYGLPWECMDKRNRDTVAFFLMNVQEPVHVKALGLANVGVTSMTAILKTSFSYFAFLKSM